LLIAARPLISLKAWTDGQTLPSICPRTVRERELTLRIGGNSRYIFINYVLNPSGSRNLEEATAASKGSL